MPDSIAALTGARGDEAGAASGLINTSQQIGGAVGIAAITTIATTASTNFARSHVSLGALLPATSLVHGFQVAFYVLAGVLFGAAVLAAVLIRPEPAVAGAGVVDEPAAGRRAAAAAPRAEPAAAGPRARAGGRRARPASGPGLLPPHALPGGPGAGAGGHDDRRVRHRPPCPAYPGDGGAAAGAEPVQVARLRSALQRLRGDPRGDAPVRQRRRRRPEERVRLGDGVPTTARRALAGKPLAVMGPSCDERDMREAQAQIRDVLGAPRGRGDGGSQPMWSCVRGDGPTRRPARRRGEVRESVRGLLVALSDVAQPAEQAA